MSAPRFARPATAAAPRRPRGRGGRLVLRSLARFVRLAARHRLRLRSERLGRDYRLFDGHVYRVFRETERRLAEERGDATRTSVVEVCFRLRWAGSSRVAHWLFQRACILTTPFWSGFDGFVTKLWMVEPGSGAYAGIYEWGEAHEARAYLAVLLPVLRAVSVRRSVAFELHDDARLDPFLDGRRAEAAPTAAG